MFAALPTGDAHAARRLSVRLPGRILPGRLFRRCKAALGRRQRLHPGCAAGPWGPAVISAQVQRQAHLAVPASGRGGDDNKRQWQRRQQVPCTFGSDLGKSSGPACLPRLQPSAACQRRCAAHMQSWLEER